MVSTSVIGEHAKSLAAHLTDKVTMVRQFENLANFISDSDHSGDVLTIFIDDLPEYTTEQTAALIDGLHQLAQMPPKGTNRKFLFVQKNDQKISLKSYGKYQPGET